MRLTHVDQLLLPFGTLHSYQATVSAPGDAVPVSFDQNRHVGAGERTGSWMALSIRLDDRVDHDELSHAWLQVVDRHGTLRTAFSTDSAGQVQAHRIEVHPGAWIQHPIAPGETMNDALNLVLNRHCSPYARPSHRLCVVEATAGPVIILASDHSHVDMWSMLILARDLLEALEGGDISDPVPAFEEHTVELRSRPPAPDSIHRRWREIIAAGEGKMPRFPLPLGDALAQPERVEVRDIFGVNDLAIYSSHARSVGVSTLALTTSIMAEVTREQANVPLRAVFPVHSRFDERWHDSCGWFVTNSVIEVTESDIKGAATAVREAVLLGSHPLEEILIPWGGLPETPGMFAISWLDLRRLPVHIDDIGLDAQYVSAAIHTDGVMLWFILDRSGAHLRCRYPDTPTARISVGHWLDAVVSRMRTHSSGTQVHILNRSFIITPARREDVPAITEMLDGTPLDPSALTRLEAAFDVLTHESSHYLAVVRDDSNTVVGAMQLTFIPQLAGGGTMKLLIDFLRVIEPLRNTGLADTMLDWAHEHGRARGAGLAELHAPGQRVGPLADRAGYTHGTEGRQRLLSQ